MVFTARQAWWKTDQDRVDRSGRFWLLRGDFVAEADRGTRYSWMPEGAGAYACVYSLPKVALPTGQSLRRAVRDLLPEAWRLAAPEGLPLPEGKPGKAHVEAHWDASTHLLSVAGAHWNGREWIGEALERTLEPRLMSANEERETPEPEVRRVPLRFDRWPKAFLFR